MTVFLEGGRLAKPKVLLVDDANTVLMLEQMMLSGEGVELLSAHNGQEALELAKQHQPKLILLDINMPVLDGIETLRQLKGDDSTKEIPVIMVTTKGETEKVETCYQIGCHDYITKPFDRTALLNKVRGLLH